MHKKCPYTEPGQEDSWGPLIGWKGIKRAMKEDWQVSPGSGNIMSGNPVPIGPGLNAPLLKASNPIWFDSHPILKQINHNLTTNAKRKTSVSRTGGCACGRAEHVGKSDEKTWTCSLLGISNEVIGCTWQHVQTSFLRKRLEESLSLQEQHWQLAFKRKGRDCKEHRYKPFWSRLQAHNRHSMWRR